MGVLSEIPDKNVLDSLANESGLAIAILQEKKREAYVSNNNSICRNLNPSNKFSPACAEFCGRALEKAAEAGQVIGFECHAGLECRAVPVRDRNGIMVAIVGRAFVKVENYRNATARAISGDWSKFPPSMFFENILLVASAEILGKTVERFKNLVGDKLVTSAVKGSEKPAKSGQRSDARPATKPTENVPKIVERFNREIGLDPGAVNPESKPEPVIAAKRNPSAKRAAETSAWRSFFGSLVKSDYPKAVDSILEFLYRQYGFAALIWLDNKDDRLENTATLGDMKNRKVRLGLSANDPRLIEVAQAEMPLELGERSKTPAKKDARTMNLFPICVEENVLAAIAILDEIKDTATKKQISRICRSIAPQLELLRLRGKVEQGGTISRAVRSFGESLKRIDAEDFWLNVTQIAAEMLRAERASLMIFDERKGALEVKALIGAKNDPAISEETGGRVAQIVFAKNEAVAVSDVSKTGLSPAPPDRLYKTNSFLSCPISIGGRAIGVMNFTDQASGNAFDRDSLELFQAIAPQLAIAIDRATLKDRAGEFEQLSVTDVLTGLLNRRYIEERLLEEVKRSNRHGFPMSFMMLDVDDFKSYNDSFGHPAGDVALKIVGYVIRDTLRAADVAARFGGEEFCILLPQTTSDEAAAIAERIRINIEHADFPHRRVTMSIGIASCSAELCVSGDLISAADKALYEAKRKGRNLVISFENLESGRHD